MITNDEWRALSASEKSALVRANWTPGTSIAHLAARIGRGISRNAVIGVYTRDKALKAECPPNAHHSAVNKANKERRKDAKPLRVARPARVFGPPPLPAEPVRRPDALMLPLADLVRSSCKWPIGDPKDADFGFCGVARYNGRPYCAYHAKLAYQPPSSRRA